MILAAGLIALGGVAMADTGRASWYTYTGNPTANGEPFNGTSMTCAHRKLPFNTMIEVTAVSTGRRARCRINDRGPFIRGRILDVSKAVARKLGVVKEGIFTVRFHVVGRALAR